MTTAELLRDIYRRATHPDTERPILTPGGEDTGVIGRASAELREALYALEVAQKALQFYADPDNHVPVEVPTNVSEDGGRMAKHALSVILGT